jgi:hypothetical protein
MRHPLRTLVCLLSLPGMLAFTAPLQAAPHDPGSTAVSGPMRDGGDVLLPDRGGYHWYLGFDAGLTYSLFQNGPLAYYTSNPYNPRYVRAGHVDEGNGLGFYIGAAADFPVSDWMGILLKLNYHTRQGAFDETIDTDELHPETTTGLTTIIHNKTDWTFSYIGFDAMLRLDLGETGAYFMIGPSFGYLLSNKAKLDQDIVQPDDIYYYEDVNGEDLVVNQFRTSSSSEEVAGFKDLRVDLKAGFGWRIELNKKLQLVPELSFAYPLTAMVDKKFTPSTTDPEPAAISDWTSFFDGRPIVQTDNDFNAMTFFFTLGLRWRIGS